MMKRLIVLALLLMGASAARAEKADPLPSWNPGKNKSAILDFVRAVTTKRGDHYVPPAERVAVFDNDGTLWVEQPIYTEVVFSIDRVRKLLAEHPEWKKKPVFREIEKKQLDKLRMIDKKQFIEVLYASHTGMSTKAFSKMAKHFLATAKHPRFDKLYTQLAYLPQLEVIAYLQANGFKTYIVSGGGTAFIRSFAGKTYGIPPENVVGSTVTLKWDLRKDGPVLLRVPPLFFFDDRDGKPVGIQLHIGRRPLIAFGNSDGDLEMLQWTAAGKGPRRMFIVHHDDAKREYKYGPNSPVGRLDKALTAAEKNGWNVISMKNDWKQIFRKAD